jgi:leucyl aminopeptidase
LLDAGLGGIWAVGRTGVRPPALVVLSYEPATPSADTRSVVWVGKGVVFDSGGLSLKRPREMLGMKADMAGAAVFLASKASDFVTGVSLTVDGGYSIQAP